jgi:Zn-dependent protease
MDPLETGVRVGLFFVPFLFSLCFHEFAHGYVAKLRGDNTAELMGRLTMNPMAHIDWLGTVAFPIIGIITGMPIFGWAKPVPVNPRNLKDVKNDMFWVALAGPMSNILLFVLGLVAFGLMVHVFQVPSNNPLYQLVPTFLFLNLILAFFNLLPMHPLDGGKIVQRFIPYSWNRWLEENQAMMNIALIVFIVSGAFVYLAKPLYYIMTSSMNMVVMMGGGA